MEADLRQEHVFYEQVSLSAVQSHVSSHLHSQLALIFMFSVTVGECRQIQ